MNSTSNQHGMSHPRLSRRQWLQAGSIGLMGLSLADVEAARVAKQVELANQQLGLSTINHVIHGQ